MKKIIVHLLEVILALDLTASVPSQFPSYPYDKPVFDGLNIIIVEACVFASNLQCSFLADKLFHGGGFI
jgi:hypothetical protein